MNASLPTVTKSRRPSPLKSPVATADCPGAIKVRVGLNSEPVCVNTKIDGPEELIKANSYLPSPLKSPAVTAPTYESEGIRISGRKEPSPLPRRTEMSERNVELVVTTSARPSPLKSPAVMNL